MTEPNVEFLGGDAAAADLKRWASELGPQIAKEAATLGERVAGTVRARVPHLSGQLAGSVESAPDDEGVAVSMGDGLDYAGWIEFGGSRGRDYVDQGRYLYPTMLDAQDEYEQVAAAASAESVGRFPWSTQAS